MNLETKITIYKFTPQVFTLTQKLFLSFPLFPTYHNRTDGIYRQKEQLTEADSFLYAHKHISKQTYLFNYPTVQKNSTV